MKHKKGYVLNDRLTVGMLEDMLKEVRNKKSIVMVADKNGQGVEPVLRAFFQDGKKPKQGVILCGGFTFSNGDEDDDEEEEIDPTEDVKDRYESLTDEQKAALACGWSRVAYDEAEDGMCGIVEPSDCIIIEKGLEYL